jgi:hypothetical protein
VVVVVVVGDDELETDVVVETRRLRCGVAIEASVFPRCGGREDDDDARALLRRRRMQRGGDGSGEVVVVAADRIIPRASIIIYLLLCLLPSLKIKKNGRHPASYVCPPAEELSLHRRYY